MLRSLRRYDAAKAAADLALTGRQVRGDREPDRELQTDLAILDVWQARCGWRPLAAAEARAIEVLHCQHNGSDATADHDTSGVSPLRSAWLMLDLAALQLWAGDLDSAAVHVHGAEPLRPPGGSPPPQLRGALGAGRPRACLLRLPERCRVGADLPRPAPIGRPGAEPGQQPRAPGPRLGALPCPPDRCGQCRSGSRRGSPARVARPDRPRLHQIAEGEPVDRPRRRRRRPAGCWTPGAPCPTGCPRSPTVTPGWLASKPPGAWAT